MATAKRWVSKPQPDIDQIDFLCAEIKVPRPLAAILIQRGITTYDQAKQFFRPQLSDLPDPFLMKDMDKAVARLNKAINEGEKILVYGDYDVDGTTSVALMYSYLHAFYPNLDYYIPDRNLEGYGISTKGVDFARDNGFSLIVALDCGIKSLDKVDYANQSGIDFIICDHHIPGDVLPAAAAVLDPKRADCEYPFKELSGCGIGFKLIQAHAQAAGKSFDEVLGFIQLVAVSIASDLVSISGENRILAYFGIRQLRESPMPGLKAILDCYVQKEDYSVSDLVFGLGPRINAAGRLADAKLAVRVMISDNPLDASLLAKSLNEHNEDRKFFDQDITKQALLMVAEHDFPGRRSNVLFHKEWHKGVIGIVASRVIEKYYRPTVVLTESNGVAVGSARSVSGFDLYKALQQCSDVLLQFGGHQFAAGMTLELSRVEEFQKKFEEVVAASIEERSLLPEIEYDYELNFADITPKFFSVLKQMEPFGPDNMKPIFMTTGVVDAGGSRAVGANSQHLKLTVFQRKDSKNIVDGIGFGMGEYQGAVKGGKSIDICYTLEENTFRDLTTIQLNLKDLKLSEE